MNRLNTASKFGGDSLCEIRRGALGSIAIWIFKSELKNARFAVLRPNWSKSDSPIHLLNHVLVRQTLPL